VDAEIRTTNPTKEENSIYQITSQVTDPSPYTIARIAGFLYLTYFITSIIADWFEPTTDKCRFAYNKLLE